MFGKKKMYKKGVSDALKANEDFSKKQEEALNFMREEVRRGNKNIEQALHDAITKLDTNIDNLYEHLNSKEIAALYHLTTPYELKDLRNEHKQLLLAMLFQLANDEMAEGFEVSAFQQGYIRSLKKYLEIANAQTSLDDLTVVGKINSLEIQKAFFQVALEFCYLQDGDELTDSQFEFFECFEMNDKTQKLIEAQVGCLFNAVGPAGIAEKYGYVPEDEPLHFGEDDFSNEEHSSASAEGVVTGIHLDVGEKGYRTIQVDLKDPIFVDGVEYDCVPVLNVRDFEEMGLRVGSRIRVLWTGDAIPSIEVIEDGGKNLELPKRCPDCGAYFVIKAKKLFCPNPGCGGGNRMGRVIGFLKGIGVEGYDEDNITKLLEDYAEKEFDERNINYNYDITTLYRLEDEKFHEALIEATATCPDYKILGSIGVPDLGPARAKVALKFAAGVAARDKAILECYKSLTGGRMSMRIPGRSTDGPDELIKVHGSAFNAFATCSDYTVAKILSGDATMMYIRQTFASIRQYMKNITTDFDNIVAVGYTGYTPSEQVLRICKENHFKVTDGNNFDILITGDYSNKSDKMQKAIAKDVPIFNEETFITRYGNEQEREQAYRVEVDIDEETGEPFLDDDGKPEMSRYNTYYERECDDKYGFIPA